MTGPLRWAPGLTLLLMLGPLVAGFLYTLAPALGWLPALGRTELGVEPFVELWVWPGLSRAAMLSVTTGLGATVVSLALVVLICAGWHDTRVFRGIERLLSPLLSVPHAAAAFGLAFLVSPSGWVARALSPGATGWERPPDLLIVQDPAGLTLVAGLVSKEVPFLLLMTLAALGQVESRRSRTIAQALGYTPVSAWLKTVFPRVYPQIRLPVYAVLAYAMSVVDVAVILGPNTPPTLSVQVVRWMNDPDLSLRFRAAAGAITQLGLVIVALGAWRVGELVVTGLGRRWFARGGRGGWVGVPRGLGLAAVAAVAGAIGFGLLGLAVWSVAGLWQFPSSLPAGLTWRTWQRQGPTLWEPALDTAVVAGGATALALGLALACLEAEHRFGVRASVKALWLLYLPLLVPQIAFLVGLQTLALGLGLDEGRGVVVVAHLVFVLPYVFLSLADPFRAWDTRFATVASALGAGPNRVFWTVRLPMLLRPVLTAAAVGFAVSVGQYLPTLLVGAGRIQTLTTEAVALASGGDRRVIGVYGLAQTAAAFVPFFLAVVTPRLVWRNRRTLREA